MTSNNELKHHGILGQKWGVRRFQNADGSYTDAGKKRYAQQMKNDVYLDKQQKSRYDLGTRERFRNSNIRSIKRSTDGYDTVGVKSGTIYEKIHNDLESAREDWKKSTKVFHDFNSNDKLIKEYQKKAARRAWEKYGDKDDPDDLKRFEFWYLEDDGDQGDGNSFQIYCEEKGLDYGKLEDLSFEASNRYRDQCEKAVKQVLGDYGDEPITYKYKNSAANTTKTLAYRVAQILTEIADDEIFDEGYYLPF